MEFGLGLILIGLVVVFVLVKNWVQRGVDVNPGQPVDWNNPKVRVMQHVVPAVVNRIDSSLESTKISYLEGDPNDTITLVMDIEQFRYLRKRRSIWEHQGLFAEREIERKWARRPPTMREWEGIQLVVPIAVTAAFNASTAIRTVRFLTGDVESGRITVCRVSVQAKRGSAKYDWRYDQRAKGYLAPVTPHGEETVLSPSPAAFADDPYDFEHQVAQMLKNRGLTVEVTGGPGDEGVDIMAYDNTPLTGGTYLVQCKRYGMDHKVGVAEVRELYGTVQEKRSSKGILVTSSVFTHQALRFAEDKPLELIDGAQLFQLIGGYNYSSNMPDDSEKLEQALNEEFQMSLHEAVQQEQLLVIAGLLEIGVDVDTRDEHGYTPLHRAAFQGNKAVAALLLENGALIDATNQNGRTPLLVALSKESREQIDLGVITLLLERGADANATVGSLTPLNIATSVEDPGLASVLLDYGADANLAPEGAMAPLRMAVGKENLSLINVLLEHGADTSISNEDGFTSLDWAVGKQNSAIVGTLVNHGADTGTPFEPLHVAVHHGHYEIVDLLLNHGAKMDRCNSDGLTPLHYAMRAETLNHSVIGALLERGAGVDARDQEGFTPLHLAAARDAGWESLAGLLEFGANIDARSHVGGTPLHLAVGHGNVNTAVFLLEHGADVNAKDHADGTALHIATGEQDANVPIIELLLKYGVDINTAYQGSYGTALHFAVSRKRPNLAAIRLLLQHKANTEADSVDGHTPLHIAAGEAPTEVVALLLEYGADIEASDSTNWRALHHAAESNHAVVPLLLRHGASPDDITDEGLSAYQLAQANGASEEVLRLLR